MDKRPAVYILASQRNGTLYTVVTSDLIGRTWQHKHHQVSGFTDRYKAGRLVWYELQGTMESAILRKRIKKWCRAWKIELIEAMNPYWNDLWGDIVGSKDTGSPLARE